MLNFRVTHKNKSYKVTAKDADEARAAVVALEENDIEDDRLSPMTYKKLKELGYSHDDWKNLSQEQANKIVAEHTTESKEPTKTTEETTNNEQPQTQVTKQSSWKSDNDKDFSDNQWAFFDYVHNEIDSTQPGEVKKFVSDDGTEVVLSRNGSHFSIKHLYKGKEEDDHAKVPPQMTKTLVQRYLSGCEEINTTTASNEQ